MRFPCNCLTKYPRALLCRSYGELCSSGQSFHRVKARNYVHCRVRPSWPSASYGHSRNSYYSFCIRWLQTAPAWPTSPSDNGCGRPQGPRPAVDVNRLPLTWWVDGGHALAKVGQYLFPRVCIQELIQMWGHQIEYSIAKVLSPLESSLNFS